jgi:hypothetical protein
LSQTARYALSPDLSPTAPSQESCWIPFQSL